MCRVSVALWDLIGILIACARSNYLTQLYVTWPDPTHTVTHVCSHVHPNMDMMPWHPIMHIYFYTEVWDGTKGKGGVSGYQHRVIHPQAVRGGELHQTPKIHEITWYRWLENSCDWCISCQLWWGHCIPAYFVSFTDPSIPHGDVIVSHIARYYTPQLSYGRVIARYGKDFFFTWPKIFHKKSILLIVTYLWF